MMSDYDMDAAEGEAAAYDQGLHAARRDIQPVYSPSSDGPLFFIRWCENSGDPSVGIDGWAQWEIVPFEDMSVSFLEKYADGK